MKRLIKKIVSIRHTVIGIGLAFCFGTVLLWAAQITFTDGTIISADEVNSNFTELYERVAQLETEVGSSSENEENAFSNPLYPDGLNGEVINHNLNGNEYTVPNGKSLYIISCYSNNSGIIKFNSTNAVYVSSSTNNIYPVVAKSGTTVSFSTAVDVFFTGILVDADAEIINHNLNSNSYTVPNGKSLYIISCYSNNSGIIKFNSTNAVYVNSGTNNIYPVVAKSGTIVSFSTAVDVFFTGYLK